VSASPEPLPSSIGEFGEYEVWEASGRSGPEWHITDGQGEIIYPGDDDLLNALKLIAARRAELGR
jgi:hypothetical protein